jgi:hypothetical protein
MACALTQGYNLDCRDGFGGVKTVYIMELANASTITAAAGVVTGITKVATKVFYEYKLIAHTGEGDEAINPNRENGTSPVTQGVKFPINKMAVAVRNEILLLAKNRLLIVIEDNNGIGWLYGKDFGMMLAPSTAKTGKALGDRNGYELSFEGTEKELAYQVDAATLLTLLTATT